MIPDHFLAPALVSDSVCAWPRGKESVDAWPRFNTDVRAWPRNNAKRVPCGAEE